MTNKWQNRVRKLKTEVFALYLAYRDPRTPWYARVFTAIVVSYALSPIDLIPDFIPVIGVLDDLVLVPIGLTLVLKMIPDIVMVESREKAAAFADGSKPVSRSAAVAIISIWLLIAVLCVLFGLRLYQSFS
jgi:uncharacterized membrane protein YkvA (DUF1232 family)